MEALLGEGTFKFRLNAYLTSHIPRVPLSRLCQLFVEFLDRKDRATRP